MLVLIRFRVPAAESVEFLAQARPAVQALAARPGCLAVRLARAVDDPRMWVLQSTWESAGAYRRALSSYDVKVNAVPLLARCLDEPSAYEVRLDAAGGEVAEHPGALAEDR